MNWILTNAKSKLNEENINFVFSSFNECVKSDTPTLESEMSTSYEDDEDEDEDWETEDDADTENEDESSDSEQP
jgi:hypothetical protein